jgi:hypothetical protein
MFKKFRILVLSLLCFVGLAAYCEGTNSEYVYDCCFSILNDINVDGVGFEASSDGQVYVAWKGGNKTVSFKVDHDKEAIKKIAFDLMNFADSTYLTASRGIVTLTVFRPQGNLVWKIDFNPQD